MNDFSATDRRARIRRAPGFTCLELLWLVVWVTCGVAGAALAGTRWGLPGCLVGGVVGVAVGVLLTRGLSGGRHEMRAEPASARPIADVGAILVASGGDGDGSRDVVAILEREGFRLVRTVGGEDALAFAREHRPEVVVVTDVLWPDEYGDRFVQSLNALTPRPAILQILGPGYDPFRRTKAQGGLEWYEFCARGYSGDAFITAPFAPQNVVHFVRRLTGVGPRAEKDDQNR